MRTARVIGTATATIKHPTLQGVKLLVVQPYLADGRTPDGDPLLAVDSVGAGRGETVMITSDRRYAQQWLQTDATPACWTTIGIED
ncbi:MAG: EutN/CcmL family microcompartment protein [Candidatus Anammoximicrobium sp.]|nr:EutN/CcmL family microcompartment protein [Candidatus Anammoximicrobium sp.]